jgi:UDP-N-acetyl-D-galactosamine dehydrogenase
VVDVHDPWISPTEAEHEYGIVPVATPARGAYDGVIVAVAHRQFRELGIDGIRALGKPGAVVFDVKYLFPAAAVDGRL